jgi:nitrilase
LKVAVIQTSSLPYEKAKINYFLSILRSKEVRLVVLPEYVLNIFFKDLEKTPIKFIKKQSDNQIKLFKKLAKRYNMTIIAPIVIIEHNKPYKIFAKFSPTSNRFYYQQIFMPYSHWNEKKFFSKKTNKPLIFKIENLSIGILPGFESHFDEYWKYFRDKNIDLVVVPSVATFESKERWRNMLSTFAFLNNCYVLRANRVGNFEEWKFYGDSFLVNPHGEIIDFLSDKEELLIVDIDKKISQKAKKDWKFLNLRKDIKWQE